MSSSMRVRAIGRGLVIVSLLLLALRMAVYIAARILMLAGYVGGLLFIAGIVLWFIGSVMTGYTEHAQKGQKVKEPRQPLRSPTAHWRSYGVIDVVRRSLGADIRRRGPFHRGAAGNHHRPLFAEPAAGRLLYGASRVG